MNKKNPFPARNEMKRGRHMKTSEYCIEVNGNLAYTDVILPYPISRFTLPLWDLESAHLRDLYRLLRLNATGYYLAKKYLQVALEWHFIIGLFRLPGQAAFNQELLEAIESKVEFIVKSFKDAGIFDLYLEVFEKIELAQSRGLSNDEILAGWENWSDNSPEHDFILSMVRSVVKK